jgi:maltose alpha-D-glucosyltransferase / alpha-amylase
MIDDFWHKNSVIYSLDLETFMDANGDGVGDFQGLIGRLDYLNALGVDVLWLAPFQPSPNRDNGYDISDFYGVDPRHGSSGDFVEFMQSAKKLGIRVIIDLVVNHTSDQHPWFKAARSDQNSRYRDWYIWSRKRPAGWNKGMVFPGVQRSIWTRDAKAGAYYYHRFYEFQPDLNWDNEEVRVEIRRIMGYWLELGVNGFRVDAVPFLLEPSPTGASAQLRFHYLSEIRRFLQWRAGDAILLGEANVLPRQNQKYFGDEGDGIHMMFNFFVNQHLFYALACANTNPLQRALVATRNLPETAQWGQFLRNHDELDLGRLSEAQRAKVFQRFGPERNMQLYHRGIRRRLAPMLGNRRNIELAYSLLFSLPGAPVIRYGDEIGMGEDLSLNERDAVRTPMQWTDERNGGFSSAKRLVHPMIAEGVYGYSHVNVEQQRRDPTSLLNWIMKLIRMRKECPEIGCGEWTLLRTGSPSTLAICYDWQGRRLITLHNFAREPQQISLHVPGTDAQLLVNLQVGEDSHGTKAGTHRLAIEEYGYRWFRVGAPKYSMGKSLKPKAQEDP